MAEHPETLGTAELTERCGRKLTSSEIETLAELGILTPAERGKYDVAIGHLEAGLKLISIGYPKAAATAAGQIRSEEHTSELQSLMRHSYAVFCFNKKRQTTHKTQANMS